jgi:fermentation-respiration switch protein FrsA (DUF1100 family)
MRARNFLLGGAALLGADAALRSYRHSQLFEPTRDPIKTWNPADYGIPSHMVEEHWIDTPDGERLHAWYCRAEKPVASGLFCHGNKANLTKSADIIPHLLTAGLNILFFDYRGFGKSSGHATYAGVIADGVTAAQFHETIRPKDRPSILYGFSLGGAVAAQVIRRHPFDGFILQSTFTSLTRFARFLHPRVPLHLLAGRLFDTMRVVRRLTVPLLVLHGSEDEVIPCAMAQEIFDACETPKRLVRIEGGLHNDLYVREPDTLVRAISQFLEELPRHTRPMTVEAAPRYETFLALALRKCRRAFRRRNSVIASAAR